MYTAAKRRVREAEKRNERVEFKFITEYTKALHGDIYKEAKELYQNIRQKYPERIKDLTKTYEFMSVVTPGKDIPRYYMHRKTKKPIIPPKRMVLEIPLIPPQVLPQPVSPQASPQPVSPQASPQPVSPQASPQPVLPQASPQPVSPQASPQPVLPQASPQPVLPQASPQPVLPQASPQPVLPQASPQPVLPQALPPLSEEVYCLLIQDLQQDPDLFRILNNFPLHDEDECMRDNIWDTIQIDDISPLEQELYNIM